MRGYYTNVDDLVDILRQNDICEKVIALVMKAPQYYGYLLSVDEYNNVTEQVIDEFMKDFIKTISTRDYFKSSEGKDNGQQ